MCAHLPETERRNGSGVLLASPLHVRKKCILQYQNRASEPSSQPAKPSVQPVVPRWKENEEEEEEETLESRGKTMPPRRARALTATQLRWRDGLWASPGGVRLEVI